MTTPKHQGKSKSGFISQRCFPTWEQLEDLPNVIESIDNHVIRELLQMNLLCGYRIGELTNSYIYFDSPQHDNLQIKSIIEKKKGTEYVKVGEKKRYLPLHTMDKRGFLGKEDLELALQDDRVWKSNNLQYVFGSKHLGWLNSDRISPSMFEPRWLFPFSYSDLYKKLKESLPPLEVYYFKGKYQEPTKQILKPSFHFFRKCFVAKLVESMDMVSAVNYMRWSDINQILFYYRMYNNKDLKEANKLYNDYGKRFD